MANIRIIYDNVAERASSITASTTATGGLAASTLNLNTKSQAHRSTTTTVTYRLDWSSAQQINGIILPATNLTGTATINVSVNGGSNLGSRLACPNTVLDSWTGVKNVNSFPYGGLSKVAYWFSTTSTNVTRLDITLTDTNNAIGYIDCSLIVCGKYWEPQYNVSKDSLELTIADTTEVTRADSGDLLADRGTIYDQLSFNLELLSQSDKDTLVKIIKNVGNYKNLAVSVFPSDGNSLNQQDYLVYGKKDTSSLNYLVHNFFSHSLSITGW